MEVHVYVVDFGNKLQIRDYEALQIYDYENVTYTRTFRVELVKRFQLLTLFYFT